MPHRAIASLVALSFGLLASCGGGSSSGTQPPPPAFTFVTINAQGSSSAPGYGTSANDINSGNTITGSFTDTSGALHGFVTTSAITVTPFDAPNAGAATGQGTVALSINNSGEIVGYFYDVQGLQHSFVRAGDGDIQTFDPPDSGSAAHSVNDAGTVVGGFIDPAGAHGYLRTLDGTLTMFDVANDPSTIRSVAPQRINAAGTVAGSYIDQSTVRHGFLRATNGTITTLDAQGAGTDFNEGTDLLDMNASGTIVGGIAVGTVNGVQNTTHSLIRSADGTFKVFDPPLGDAVSSIAKAINDDGVVVGEYRDASQVRHGYMLKTDGTFVSFDDPEAAQLPLSEIAVGTIPIRINAGGYVVGAYSTVNGVRFGFLMQ